MYSLNYSLNFHDQYKHICPENPSLSLLPLQFNSLHIFSTKHSREPNSEWRKGRIKVQTLVLSNKVSSLRKIKYVQECLRHFGFKFDPHSHNWHFNCKAFLSLTSTRQQRCFGRHTIALCESTFTSSPALLADCFLLLLTLCSSTHLPS